MADHAPIADRALADLETVREHVMGEIRRLLLRLDTQRGSGELVGDRQALSTARQVYLQIEEQIAQRGLPAVRTAAEHRAIEAAQTAVPSGIPADAARELRAIVSGQTQDVAEVFREAAGEIRRAINVGTTTGADLADLVAVVEERLGVAFTKASAAVDAAVMAAGRRATVATALAAASDIGVPLVFVYVGPRDGKNRPFCAQWVGRAVTQSALAGLDNGQGLPVADYCGGYNCRHTWAPMTVDEARARGIEAAV